MKTIVELSEGEEFEGVLWLVNASVRQTKNGAPYWEGTFQDASSSISAKLWDSAGGRKGRVAVFEPVLQPGGPVRIRARVDSFQGTPQLQVESAESVDLKDVDPGRFSPVSARPLEEMVAEFDAMAASIRDTDYKRLLEAFRADPDLFGAFSRAPAAKTIHHAWVHGLLEHSLSLARAAKRLAPSYPFLDLDLVLMACVFHDAQKAEEISALPGFEYTVRGKLLGHIYMGARLVETLCAAIGGIPEEKKLQLVHLVLSHQGDRSEGFGSPVDPQTPEAIFFHHLDNLDAKVQHCMTSLQKAEESGSEDDFIATRGAVRRSYYRRRLNGGPIGNSEGNDRSVENDHGKPFDENADSQPRLW